MDGSSDWASPVPARFSLYMLKQQGETFGNPSNNRMLLVQTGSTGFPAGSSQENPSRRDGLQRPGPGWSVTFDPRAPPGLTRSGPVLLFLNVSGSGANTAAPALGAPSSRTDRPGPVRLSACGPGVGSEGPGAPRWTGTCLSSTAADYDQARLGRPKPQRTPGH